MYLLLIDWMFKQGSHFHCNDTFATKHGGGGEVTKGNFPGRNSQGGILQTAILQAAILKGAKLLIPRSI